MPERRTRSDAARRLRQASRLARVIRVLELIQSRGRWNVQNLAAELECSERTVYRDMATLELAGVPWTFDQSAQCYRVRPDYRFPTLNLTDDELVGQAIASRISSSDGLRIGAGSGPTTQKLSAAGSERSKQLVSDAERIVSVLGLKIADHSRHGEMIRTVQWSLLERRQLIGQYRSPYEPKPVKLTLDPYRLCLVKQAWYLIARPSDDREPRTYRIARFQRLKMSSTPADMPEDFNLKDYFGNAWAVYRGDTTYDVEIRFTPEASCIVTETIWHSTQKTIRHKDGSVSLQFKVDGLNEILHWLLGWAGRSTVVRPTELRQLVVDCLRKGLEQNAI